MAGSLSAFSGRSSSVARASSAWPAASRARARPEITSGFSGRHLEDLLEDVGGALGIAFGQHLLAHRDQRLDLGLELLRLALDRQLGEDLVERAGQLAFGPRRGQVGDRLALEEGVDGRDRLDAELGGDELLLVDIDLDQLDAAIGIIGGDLLEHRRRAACTGRTIPPRNRG